MQNKQKKHMQKKIHPFVGMSIIGIFAVIIILFVTTVSGEIRSIYEKYPHNDNRKINPKTSLKTVPVSDGEVSFAFQVPRAWLVETRNAGDKKMSTQEMRDFLATNYDGDIRNNSQLTSDYADYSWTALQEKTDKEIQNEFMISSAFTQPKPPRFPNVSVGAREGIWYTDWSAYQVDFYVLKESIDTLVSEKRRELESQKSNCLSLGGDSASCEYVWSDVVVAGQSAQQVQFPLDNGEVTKDETGGKMVYVPIPNTNKTLVIYKQAMGDAFFEKNIDTLLSSLQFSQ